MVLVLALKGRQSGDGKEPVDLLASLQGSFHSSAFTGEVGPGLDLEMTEGWMWGPREDSAGEVLAV